MTLIQPKIQFDLEKDLEVGERGRVSKCVRGPARDCLAQGVGIVACGPLVRSSYHADKQAHGEIVK